jgi:hypothetical protein
MGLNRHDAKTPRSNGRAANALAFWRLGGSIVFLPTLVME